LWKKREEKIKIEGMAITGRRKGGKRVDEKQGWEKNSRDKGGGRRTRKALGKFGRRGDKKTN